MKFVAILIVTTVLAVSCGGVVSPETPTSVSSTSATTVAQMTSFEKMEIAFEGGYNKAEIKPRLERAMDLYGVPITEEIYSRAGSTLVALRKNTAVKEMDILGYMICSHVPGVDMTFPDAAALSASFIASGDKC